MPTSFELIENEALQLSATDRARLVERLISSLDEPHDSDSEHVWQEEVEKRYREYREGLYQTKPAEDVIQDAYSKLT